MLRECLLLVSLPGRTLVACDLSWHCSLLIFNHSYQLLLAQSTRLLHLRLVHNLSLELLFLLFLSETEKFLVVGLLLAEHLLHQELRVEAVLVLTVYEVLN